MKCMRFVVPCVVLAVFFVTFAHSQTDRSAASRLLDNFKRGDNVTIGLGMSRATVGAYSIRVLTEDELKEITAKVEQYEDEVREYEDKQQANQEELRRLADEARSDPQKRKDLMTRMRNLSRPRRPDPVYQVSVVGDDYVGLRLKGRETLVPTSNIASIRRQIEVP